MPTEKNHLDIAFGLAKNSFNIPKDKNAKELLHKSFPEMSAENLSNAYSIAKLLSDQCYWYGDQCIEKNMTDQQAIEHMQKNHPGFTEYTYKSALSHGYFIAR